MDPITRPTVVARLFNDSSADGILFDVPQTCQPLPLAFDQDRPMAVSPNRPNSLVFSIEVLRITGIDSLHCARQCRFMGRRNLKVIVIAHDDVRMNIEAFSARRVPNEL